MAKKIHPKFFGKISNGRAALYPTDKKYFDGYLNTFMDGQEIEMTIKNKFKKRTSKQYGEGSNQNGYYWGVPMVIISEEMGEFDKEDLHNWIQVQVGHSRMMPGGTIVPKGTSKLSAGEFEDYCAKVRMWCAIPGNLCEEGAYIPEPHEVEVE